MRRVQRKPFNQIHQHTNKEATSFRTGLIIKKKMSLFIYIIPKHNIKFSNIKIADYFVLEFLQSLRINNNGIATILEIGPSPEDIIFRLSISVLFTAPISGATIR